MALSALKTFVAGEILLASELNNELNQIYTSTSSLISPLTATLDAGGNKLILDGDDDTSIHADTDDQIDFEAGGTDVFVIDGTVASPINGLTMIAGATGVAPTLQVMSEVDIGMVFEAKDGEEMLELEAVAIAANNIKIISSTAGTNPVVASNGDTDNTGIDFEQKDGDELLVMESVDAAVNHFQTSNAATGSGPILEAVGGDTNIGINLTPKGSGVIALNGNLDPNGNAITDGGGLELLTFTEDGSAVNHVELENEATGSGPIIRSAGDDTNVDLNINTKGTGSVVITGGATGTVDLGNAALSIPNSDGAANTVMTSDGSGTLSLAAATVSAGTATSSILPLPRSYLGGCKMTITGSNQDVSVTVGQARGGTAKDGANFDLANLVLSSTLVKQIDAAWAVGTNQGGYAGAAGIAVSTWYHFFLIENGSGTVDAGWDDDIDCANLLSASSYTNFRRIASMLTTSGTANIMLPWLHSGDYFYWMVPLLGYTADNIDASSGLDLTNTAVPPDVIVNGSLNAWANTDLTSAEHALFQPDNTTLTQPASDTMPGQLRGSTIEEVSAFGMLHDNQKITVYTEADTSFDLSILTNFYHDRRGRDD